MLARAGDGESFFVEKFLNAHEVFDVALSIEPLSLTAFLGAELREFCLPKTEDVGRKAAEFGDFSDAEVELVRDDDVIGGAVGLCFRLEFCAARAHLR